VFDSPILDISIGLVLVYLLLALICSIGSELIATYVLKLRSRTLRDGIRTLLDGDSSNANMRALYAEPFMKSLGKDPSYVPARRFAKALLAVGDIKLDAATAKITNSLPAGSHLEKQVGVLIAEADGDIEKLEGKLATWFDDSMERVSGWYKRRSQIIVAALAIGIVGALNADTLTLIKALEVDPGLRDQVVQAAVAEAKSDETLTQDLPQVQRSLAQLDLPLRGWIARSDTLDDPREAPDWGWSLPYKFVGLALTAAAVSLGAPFWFDLLKRAVNLRSGGSVPARPPKPPK
jgi:hypothetical protein